MIIQTAMHLMGVRLKTFYDGALDRNVLAHHAALLTNANANSNRMAFLRTRADLNQPSDTQDWFNGAPPTKPAELATYAVVVGAQNEVVAGVMYDHHGDQDNFKPGDGNTEFSGRQVLVHLANGDHEAYPKAGVYDRPMGTHDYRKENAYRFDQRAGAVEIYLWSGAGFSPMPPGATPELQGSRMAHLPRPLGKPRARQLGRAGFRARVGSRGTVPPRRICAPSSADLSPSRPPRGDARAAWRGPPGSGRRARGAPPPQSADGDDDKDRSAQNGEDRSNSMHRHAGGGAGVE